MYYKITTDAGVFSYTIPNDITDRYLFDLINKLPDRELICGLMINIVNQFNVSKISTMIGNILDEYDNTYNIFLFCYYLDTLFIQTYFVEKLLARFKNIKKEYLDVMKTLDLDYYFGDRFEIIDILKEKLDINEFNIFIKEYLAINKIPVHNDAGHPNFYYPLDELYHDDYFVYNLYDNGNKNVYFDYLCDRLIPNLDIIEDIMIKYGISEHNIIEIIKVITTRMIIKTNNGKIINKILELCSHRINLYKHINCESLLNNFALLFFYARNNNITIDEKILQSCEEHLRKIDNNTLRGIRGMIGNVIH